MISSSGPDRIYFYNGLIVLCFASALLLSSQSAASFATYLLALFVSWNTKSWLDVVRVREIWSVFALLLYLALSSLWSKPLDLGEFGSNLGRALLIFCFVLAWAECQIRGRLHASLVYTMGVFGVLVAVAALVAFMQNPPEDGRLAGLGQLDNPVVMALIFGFILLYLGDLALAPVAIWMRVAALVAMCLLAYAIYLSDSRNAWFATVVGLAVLVIAWAVADRQRFLITTTAAGLLLGAALLALSNMEPTTAQLLPRGSSYRLEIWAEILARVVDGSWVFGQGIDTSDNSVIDGITFLHAHNMYISVLFQGGLIGLGLFGLVIVQTLATLLANYQHRAAKLGLGVLALALSSYLVDGHELLDKIGETWFLFWSPVAIAIGLRWVEPPRVAET